jgi:hypothetical protein
MAPSYQIALPVERGAMQHQQAKIMMMPRSFLFFPRLRGKWPAKPVEGGPSASLALGTSPVHV